MEIKRKFGFSILEISIVLLIVGLIGAGALLSYSEQRTHVLWVEAEDRLSLVKSSLLNFVKTNNYLPCPDSNGDGFENRSSGVCSTSQGEIPFNDLQLSIAEVSDSYGNKILYAVTGHATNSTDLTSCPTNSACFLNNISPPAFDMTTEPVPRSSTPGTGTPVNKNLRICNTPNCISSSSGSNISGDNLIVVLVAFNENGHVTSGLGAAEAENRDNDQYFTQIVYSKDPFYDDRIESISANELKERIETEIVMLTGDDSSDSDVDNPFADTTVPIAGGHGDNDRFAEVIGLNIVTGTLDFGQENAGKMVTVTFDMYVTGDWEDADALDEGQGAEYSGDRVETQDQFVVAFNSDVDQTLYDHASDGTLVDLDEGLNMLLGESGKSKEELHEDEEYSDQFFFYDANDDPNDEWFEYNSYNTQLDENGQLKIDFANFSTQESEYVEISNLEGVIYNAPQEMPKLPSEENIDQLIGESMP